jgi:beta-mannosidase
LKNLIVTCYILYSLNLIRYGDVHFYNYDFLCTNESAFPNARFVSEYGWQSYPSLFAWENVTLESDLTLNSQLMKFRQHHDNGNQEMARQIKMHFKEPMKR